MKKSVRVNLGSRSYEIIIAPKLIRDAKLYLDPVVAGRRVALISDQMVTECYMGELSPILDSITKSWNYYMIEGGEDAKSFSSLEKLINGMLSDGIDRQCVVIAFGGGVVGDVAGFAAALVMRGIELIQIPTTLMSQVDSSVGGKNAINTHHGKNLVGSFLQPRIVLNDVSLLSSLPKQEMQSGYGEIIKYGLLRGTNEFLWLEDNLSSIMTCDESALVEVIKMGCETKAGIVSEDELDRGKRALVNLGHTFAHAFETHAGFGLFPHGLAVAVGLIAACDLSARNRVCEESLAERVRRHILDAGMPTDLVNLSGETHWDKEAIYSSMLHDKKTVNGQINFVLMREIGEPFVSNEVPQQLVFETLEKLGAV